MALPREPFRELDPLAEGWDDMIARNRALQAPNDPLFGGGSSLGGTDDGYAALLNRADLSMADWQRLRGQQLAGAPMPTGVGVSLAAVGQRVGLAGRKPLTGRPGTAASVADALNRVAGGPNAASPVDTRQPEVHGTLTRGPGRDLRFEGNVALTDRSKVGVTANGQLDPSTDAPEVTISNPRARLGFLPISLPPRIKVYNTHTGELDYDLSGPIRIGPKTIVQPGTYVIGEPDPPRRRGN